MISSCKFSSRVLVRVRVPYVYVLRAACSVLRVPCSVLRFTRYVYMLHVHVWVHVSVCQCLDV